MKRLDCAVKDNRQGLWTVRKACCVCCQWTGVGGREENLLRIHRLTERCRCIFGSVYAAKRGHLVSSPPSRINCDLVYFEPVVACAAGRKWHPFVDTVNAKD